MQQFKKNKKNRQSGRYLMPFIGFLLLFIFGFLAINDVRVYQKKKELAFQLASLQTQVKDIQTRNNNLKQGIANSDNSQYIEKVAREELDLQQPGEQAVSFVMPPPSTQKNDNAQKNNWFSWLLDKITGKP